MSQGELAAAIGVSNSYLSHIEAGRRPVSGPIADQVAAALGIDVAQLENGVPADQKDELRLKLSFGEMALRNGDWTLALQTFAEASAQARELPLERFIDEATWGRARALEATGQLEEAIAVYEELRERPHLSPSVARTNVCRALVRAYSECGDLGRAIDVGESALSELHEPVDVVPRVELLCTLAGCYVERGDLTRAGMLTSAAQSMADDEGSLRARASAAWESALVAAERHQDHQARVLADRALALYRELDAQRAIGLLHIVSANVYLRQAVPDPDSALPLLERAVEELRSSGTALDVGYARTEQARAYLARGEVERAGATAAEALAGLPEGERIQRGRMLLIQGRAARQLGSNDQALSAFESAAACFELAGASRRSGAAWRELGEAYVELGRPAEAIEAFRKATDAVGLSSAPRQLGTAVRASPISD